MKVLLACDRSAGHIFPALSIAGRISGRGGRGGKHEVIFFATALFLKEHIERNGFTVLGKSFRRRNLAVESAWRLFESLFIIFKFGPDAIIGFGGRDSFFLVLFGRLLGLDTAIYEPNLNFGRANRILSLFTGSILRGFPDDGPAQKFRHIGIPLRPNIKKIDKAQARKVIGFDSRPVLFCMGGSQGASFLNRVFSEFVAASGEECRFIHLTGGNDYARLSDFYDKIKKKVFIRDFYYNIEVLYSAADIVVSRAGAGTLGEISFYGIPAVLIPYAGGNDHQRENAAYLRGRGAALVCQEEGFSSADFNGKLRELVKNEKLKNEVASNLSKIKLGVEFEEFCGDIDIHPFLKQF